MDSLPEPLPDSPLPLFEQWFREARELHNRPNPDAMVLASATEGGRPSARVVLCKRIDAAAGYLVFFTNYHSRKARELLANPHAAGVFHWDSMHRQVRVEGRIVQSPPEESDAYFASRALDSRIGAWASQQSQPLASRAALAEQVAQASLRLGIAPGAATGVVPRPSHWGGFRLWLESVELWMEGPNRIHDRAVWTRHLEPRASEFAANSWSASRLNP
ncbi:MAG TPA: pyridoxamine 5'-phosphate oxidase [Steroidobacteraceae bacterium]|nr:pyridoxamine 5'-phosphate oxidase [Steroidobacteraceae bacterium]